MAPDIMTRDNYHTWFESQLLCHFPPHLEVKFGVEVKLPYLLIHKYWLTDLIPNGYFLLTHSLA